MFAIRLRWRYVPPKDWSIRREEAIRVIKNSGKWTPAVQNGRTVKSYKQQPVTFKLAD